MMDRKPGHFQPEEFSTKYHQDHVSNTHLKCWRETHLPLTCLASTIHLIARSDLNQYKCLSTGHDGSPFQDCGPCVDLYLPWHPCDPGACRYLYRVSRPCGTPSFPHVVETSPVVAR